MPCKPFRQIFSTRNLSIRQHTIIDISKKQITSLQTPYTWNQFLFGEFYRFLHLVQRTKKKDEYLQSLLQDNLDLVTITTPTCREKIIFDTSTGRLCPYVPKVIDLLPTISSREMTCQVELSKYGCMKLLKLITLQYTFLWNFNIFYYVYSLCLLC